MRTVFYSICDNLIGFIAAYFAVFIVMVLTDTNYNVIVAFSSAGFCLFFMSMFASISDGYVPKNRTKR